MNRMLSPICSRRSAQQVDDRGLHRDVERGGDLVADEQRRLGGERAGDRDPLALAARQLIGKRFDRRRADSATCSRHSRHPSAVVRAAIGKNS